jgi:hypothetical protein
MLIDSSCTIPLVYLNKEDCLGDTVGKFNYNALALDTTMCNLSSMIKNTVHVISSLDLLINDYQEYYEYVNTNLLHDFKKASTTVNLLSSYWGHYEFSTQMPINAISLSSNDLNIIAITLSSINLQTIDSLVTTTLKPLAESYLNTDYAPSLYSNNAVVNLTFFIYNITPVIKKNPTDADALIKSKFFPVAVYSFNNRRIEAQYTRDNIYLTTGVILRFIVENNRWTYIGYYLNDEINTAEPNYNNQVIQQFPNKNYITAKESKTILGSCDTIELNTWYSTQQYIYANSMYAGTSNKLGKISLTLRTPSNESVTFSYKANGYNANTNTGGTDVYLEFNGDIINAYEQYPVPKTLVQSWINPYSLVKGVNFKFTHDSKGVSFTACASKNLI